MKLADDIIASAIDEVFIGPSSKTSRFAARLLASKIIRELIYNGYEIVPKEVLKKNANND